ncbi:hypothetical protein RB595_006751 [Gaeumannomyces hyphopodioides]
MLRAQWVCRRCLRSSPRPAFLQLIRKASTAADTNGGLPQILLLRARKLAAEHVQLKAALESGFEATKAKRAGEIAGVTAALGAWEKARASIGELEALVASPAEDPEMRDLARDELESTRADLDALGGHLSAALTPKHPFADMPCLIELRPGPGGLEGRFFADQLFRMYQNVCARRGYRTRVVSYELAEGAGDMKGSDGEMPLQEAILEVQHGGAYDVFRGESGMHRVQRVPATEKQGRTHTSAVAVWVLPSFPEAGEAGEDSSSADLDDPSSDLYIDPTEVRTETMRARGAGGQHVNKTESAIRLTHVPSGTVVSMQDSRSQQRNREEAWKILRSRVAAQRREQREEQAASLRSSVLSKDRITRGDKIRTYNYSQDRVTDHRSGVDAHSLPDAVQGGPAIDRILDSAREYMMAKDLRMLIADEEAAAAAAAAGEGGGKGKK